MTFTPRTHKRYLEYRERHGYFGRGKTMLSSADFLSADTELDALEAKGEKRDDEEEARYAELLAILLRD